MPADFLTDEEMAALEQQQPTDPAAPAFVPDVTPEWRAQFATTDADIQRGIETVTPSSARSAILTAASLGTVPFTGGLGIAARLGIAGLAGVGSSLLSETVDPTEGGPADALVRAAGTGASFAAGEGVGSLVGAGVRAVGPSLRRAAQNIGAFNLGISKPGFRKLGAQGAREMAQVAGYDAGVLSPLAGGETLLGRASAAQQEAGQALGALRGTLDQRGAGVGAASIASELENRLLRDVTPGTPLEQDLRVPLTRMRQTLAGYARRYGGNLPATALEAIKHEFSELSGRLPLSGGATDPAWEVARSVLQDAEDSLARGFLPADDLARWFAEKTRYGALSKATASLRTEAIPRELANRSLFGLSTQLGAGIGAGVGGAVSGGPGAFAGSLLGGVASRFLHQKGPGISGAALNRLANAAGATGAHVARSGAALMIDALNPALAFIEAAERNRRDEPAVVGRR